jgi:hypothetical protein
MEAMRESWTDDRLDDLANRVDNGFDRIDTDVRELRAEMNTGFGRVDGEFRAVRGEMKAGFEQVDGEFCAMRREMKASFQALEDRIDRKFDSLWRMMVFVYATLIGPLLGLLAALVVTQA